MNKRFIAGSLVLAAAVSITGAVLSQDRQDAPTRNEIEERMRAMMPGEQHQRFTRYVGEYDVTTRFIMPDMDPIESTGSATVKSALGDRFIAVETTGSMMGRPYSSVQWYGYNNASKRYESVWMYTMGTSMMWLDGKSTDNGATVQWTATHSTADGKETLLVTTRFDETDRFVIELRHEDDGEGGVMTTTYTRRN